SVPNPGSARRSRADVFPPSTPLRALDLCLHVASPLAHRIPSMAAESNAFPSPPAPVYVRGDPPHRHAVQDLPAPQLSRYLIVKAVLDFAVALVLFALTAPLIGLLALLVRLTSPGPAFYLQARLGKRGRVYWIIKLRTMYHNCEIHSGPRWSSAGDLRVTPLGRLLRRTHLDELPQLWNVLCGDMSLVGPRPERPEFLPALEQAVPHYCDRLLIRPGVTGLAQVQLPPDIEVEGVRNKVACDVY